MYYYPDLHNSACMLLTFKIWELLPSIVVRDSSRVSYFRVFRAVHMLSVSSAGALSEEKSYLGDEYGSIFTENNVRTGIKQSHEPSAVTEWHE